MPAPTQPAQPSALVKAAPLLVGIAAIAAIGIGFWYLYKKQNEQRRTTGSPQVGEASREVARARQKKAARKKKAIKTRRAFPARVVRGAR